MLYQIIQCVTHSFAHLFHFVINLNWIKSIEINYGTSFVQFMLIELSVKISIDILNMEILSHTENINKNITFVWKTCF